MVSRPPGSVVLLSGGMDSATCLAVASRDDRPVHALTVVYGQRHAREVRSARTLARHFEVASHAVVRMPLGPLVTSALTDRAAPLPHRRRPGRSPRRTHARNTILLALALGHAERRGVGAIYLGANAIDYSGYPDCRPEFLTAFNRLALRATKTGVEEGWAPTVRAPLLRLSKADVVRLGDRLGVPWRSTWSCYAGGAIRCCPLLLVGVPCLLAQQLQVDLHGTPRRSPNRTTSAFDSRRSGARTVGAHPSSTPVFVAEARAG